MKTIKINRTEWKVFFVDKTHAQLADESGEQIAYGITLPRECEIYIDNGLPKGMMRKIVTHELVHAIAFSYGVNLEHATEEDICDFIGIYFDVLKPIRKAVLKTL